MLSSKGITYLGIMFKISYLARLLKNVPLKTVLVVPFVFQLILAMGLVGIFIFYNRLMVVVIPESQFTGSMQDYTQIVILLYFAILAIAILMSMMIWRSISSSLEKLSEASQAVTQGKLNTRVSVEGTREIQVLTASFNTMVEMIANSLLQLEQSNQDLTLNLKETSYELNASKASFQRINFLLSRREDQLRKQQDFLLGLTKDKSINQGDFIGAVQNITYTGSHALSVERVSIWLFDTAKTLLHCLDLYIKSTNTHTEANFLTAQDYPQFFAALQSQTSISVEDVQEEAYLQEILDYFNSANTVSLLIKPFEVNGELTGIIAFEHTDVERLWLPEEHSFASSLADLLALGMESQERRRAEEKLRIEQMKSERLLLNVLPQEIVERLKLSQSKALASKVVEAYSNNLLEVDPMLDSLTNGKISGAVVADAFDEVTVLFADIVNFTEYAAAISASDLVNCLNDIFSEFDRLVDVYELEKIKTIGDSYMAVGGLPTPSKDHAEAIAEMALEMQASIQQFKRTDGSPFSLRIGIHTGQAIAGVIGTKKFIYDLWGDTVNVASRMESQGVAGCIQVTEVTYHLLKDKYQFDSRREIDIKGKGKMITYLLIGKLSS
ncbi:adenylate/guanylate cyclase [Pseudanabaena sp. ABRG5-3]|nr:adenylate/guanylate cyclase [Pseudanabaena sp. ABRG5-3]